MKDTPIKPALYVVVIDISACIHMDPFSIGPIFVPGLKPALARVMLGLGLGLG